MRLLVAALVLAFAPVASASSGELVTVTTDSAVATWMTASPGDSTACWSAAGVPQQCVTQESGVTLHRVEIDGLFGGTTYSYTLSSGGASEPVSLTNPGVFSTLTPPPGRHLFDFALMSDLHIGEGCAGTAVSAPLTGTSVPPCFSAPDYAETMDRAAVAEIAARRIGLTLVDGDVTAEARPAETALAADVLHGLPGRVLVARGNHDRVHSDDDHAACAEHDCFRATFHPRSATSRIYFSTSYGGVHFIVLDSVMGGSTGDLTDAGQNEWLAADLAAHASMPTFIAFHHPVSEYADLFEAEPIIFGVPPNAGGTAFLHTVAENPQIVGVFGAHTHRNFNSYGGEAGVRTPFVENGTAKEYPGGYSVVSLYEGGYTRSFFRTGCAFCREWTQTTTGEYFGLAPQYVLGSLGTRNFTHVYGCDAEDPVTSLPGTESLIGGVVTPPARCLQAPVTPVEFRFRVLGHRLHGLRLRCVSAGPCAVRGRVMRHGRFVARVRRVMVADGATRRLRVRRVPVTGRLRGRAAAAGIAVLRVSGPTGHRTVRRRLR
ncbi:MAG: 3,5-cyclic-AMP phosphodiesterase [Solirubrobacteraceae bacterium]|nr:3,5-cyclic-AMP phosphodiesterase [Solirubrobacteraceae bacterium]